MKKPLPASVQGIYDAEQYNRWVAYTHERRRFRLINGAINTALMVAILALDLLAVVYTALAGSLPPVSDRLYGVLLVTIFSLFFSIVDTIKFIFSTSENTKDV